MLFVLLFGRPCVAIANPTAIANHATATICGIPIVPSTAQ